MHLLKAIIKSKNQKGSNNTVTCCRKYSRDSQIPAKQRQVLTKTRAIKQSPELEVSIKTVEKRMQAAFKALGDAVGKDVKRYRL